MGLIAPVEVLLPSVSNRVSRGTDWCVGVRVNTVGDVSVGVQSEDVHMSRLLLLAIKIGKKSEIVSQEDSLSGSSRSALHFKTLICENGEEQKVS